MESGGRRQLSLYLGDDELKALDACPASKTVHGWIVGLGRQAVRRRGPIQAVAARRSPGTHRRTIALPLDLADELTAKGGGAPLAEVVRTLILSAAGIEYQPVDEADADGDLVVPIAVPRAIGSGQVVPTLEVELQGGKRSVSSVLPVRIPPHLRSRIDELRGELSPSIYLSTMLASLAQRRRDARFPMVRLVTGDPRIWRERITCFERTGWPPHAVHLVPDMPAEDHAIKTALESLDEHRPQKFLIRWDAMEPPEGDGVAHLCRVVCATMTSLGLSCDVEVATVERGVHLIVLAQVTLR